MASLPPPHVPPGTPVLTISTLDDEVMKRGLEAAYSYWLHAASRGQHGLKAIDWERWCGVKDTSGFSFYLERNEKVIRVGRLIRQPMPHEHP